MFIKVDEISPGVSSVGRLDGGSVVVLLAVLLVESTNLGVFFNYGHVLPSFVVIKDIYER